jgi:hypothetical protein
MNWYRRYNKTASKKVKIASMDVYVKDYIPPKSYETIGDMSWYLSEEIWKVVQKLLTEEEIQYFRDNKPGEWFTGDGDDFFNRTGVMNFYINGLPLDRINKILSAVRYYLSEIDVESGVPSAPEQSGTYKSQVIRIPILKNENKLPDNTAPQLNMSNTNAIQIFEGVLNFKMEDYTGCFDAWQVISRIDRLIPRQISEFERETNDTQEEGKPRHIDIGIDSAYINDKVQRIREIAQWATDNNYQKICVG